MVSGIRAGGRVACGDPARNPASDARPGRILVLVQNLPVPLDRRVWLECQALVDARFQVSVICPKAPDDPGYELLDGVHLHKYAPPSQAQGFLGYVWEVVYCWLATALLTFRVLCREGFDVIQACNPPDTFFALAALFKPFGKQFVYDQHDLCPELFDVRFPEGSVLLQRIFVLLERSTYRLADKVIVTNRSFREIALRRGGRDPSDVTIVRSGPRLRDMEPGCLRPELRKGRRFLVSYLGVMGPQDGVGGLVDAISHLVHRHRRSDIHFALLGFGDCLEELRTRAHHLGLDDWITFTGRADDQMIDAYLSTADLAVAPDPSNGFNDLCTMNKVVEYLAYGLPVVAFDLAETRTTAGDAALYVRGHEASDLAGAIARLLDDPPERDRMGRRGRHRFEAILAWDHAAPTYVSLYRQLLGGGTNGLRQPDMIVLDDGPEGAEEDGAMTTWGHPPHRAPLHPDPDRLQGE